MNGLADFHAAMRAAGLDFDGPLLADGKLHRIKVEGDHERNSWYVLHDGSPAAGAFGCWKRGIKETWCDRSQICRRRTGTEFVSSGRPPSASAIRPTLNARRKRGRQPPGF
jgi:phage/plasmid primase-like uncharacterized protein